MSTLLFLVGPRSVSAHSQKLVMHFTDFGAYAEDAGSVFARFYRTVSMLDRTEETDEARDLLDMSDWIAALRQRDCNKPRRNIYDTAMDVIAKPARRTGI
jgi:hypothetical protein